MIGLKDIAEPNPRANEHREEANRVDADIDHPDGKEHGTERYDHYRDDRKYIIDPHGNICTQHMDEITGRSNPQ